MYSSFNSWAWKIALLIGLIAIREAVRLTGASTRAAAPVLRPASDLSATPVANEYVKGFIEALDSAILITVLLPFIVQPFLLQAFYIPSPSMENTLRVQDRLLVSKLIYRLRDPRFQDVVIFKAPPLALETSGLAQDSAGAGETDFIKRCIGTPGDIVYVNNRGVFRKARGAGTFTLLREPYIKWSRSLPMQAYDMKIIGGRVYSREYYRLGVTDGWKCEGRLVPREQQQAITKAVPGAVPSGQYLVFGDHRNNSNDGHVWGFVPRENIVGKALCVFWPPARLNTLDRIGNPRSSMQSRTGGTAPKIAIRSSSSS